MQFTWKLEPIESIKTKELETIRNEIVNLAVTVTKRLKRIEELLEMRGNKEQEVEEQILRGIQGEINFIKGRFGVSVEMEISVNIIRPHEVTVTTRGARGNILHMANAVRTNVYECMLTAFWKALNRKVPDHFTGLPPTNLRHTEQELKEVLGCDVKVTGYPGH